MQGYIDFEVRLDFDRHVAFETDDIALAQNARTLTKRTGQTATGVTVEVARRRSDGRWQYVIDSPDGAPLLGK